MSNLTPTHIPLPFESADFHFAPTELPSARTDLNTFLAECNQRINWMICEAWAAGALPERTALVQCLTASPIHKVDFAHPCILRRSTPQKVKRVSLLGAFAHTTWFLEKGHSSHARVRQKGDTSRGTVVIFTKQAPEPDLPNHMLLSNHLHFGFPETDWSHRTNFGDCEKHLLNRIFYPERVLGAFDQDFEAFDAKAFVRYSNEQKLESIIKRKPAPATWTGMFHPAARAEDASKIGELFESIREDSEYQDRVATLLECGAIVLCIPQSFKFAKQIREDGFILDSGLTVILNDHTPPTLDELRQINAVAYKISLFIGSTDGIGNWLARNEAWAKLNLVAKAVDHELRNATANVTAILNTIVRSGKPLKKEDQADIKARLNSAKAALEALTEIGQSTAKRRVIDEFSEVTSNFRNYGDFALDVRLSKEVQESIAEVPSAFRLLLSELIRNAYKHNPSALVRSDKCVATVELQLSGDHVELIVRNPVDPGATFNSIDGPNSTAETGFGLTLVDRLCTELNAVCLKDVADNNAQVAVKIPLCKQ